MVKKNWKLLILFVIFCFELCGCSQPIQQIPTTISTQKSMITESSTPIEIPTIPPTPELPVLLNTPLPVTLNNRITAGNISSLELIAVANAFPAYIGKISEDGKIVVIGTTEGIYIYNDNKELIKRIDSHLDYINYYAFSWQSDLTITPDGNKIALMNREGIWVFSVQGDLIFHKDYNFPDTYEVTTPPPNIIINSEGNLIAVRYADINRDQAMFEVINIEEDKTELLEKASSGNSSLFYPIKFSKDSSILVTMDYSRSTGSKYRFWNTGDWFEISEDVAIDRNIFSPGEMLTAEFDKGEMIVKNKFTDEIINSIELFKWNDNWQQFANQGYEPKRMSPIFSEDGTKVAYFDIYKSDWYEWNYFPYLAGMEEYFLKIVVYDLVSNIEIGQYDTYATGFSTIQLTNKGIIIDPLNNLFSTDNAWYEQGQLLEKAEFIDSNKISFYSSHIISIHNPGNFYQSVNPRCIFSFLKMNIECEEIYIKSTEKNYSTNRYAGYEIGIEFYENSSKMIVSSIIDGKIVFEKSIENNLFATTPVFINENVIAYTLHNIYDSNYYEIIFYDFSKKETVSQIRVDKDLEVRPKTISFCSSNGMIAIGSNDGFIKFIDTEKNQIIYEQKSHNTSIIGLLFSPDCNSLVSIDEVGFIKVWGIPPFSPITLVSTPISTQTQTITTVSELMQTKNHIVPTITPYPENYETPTLAPTKTPQPSAFCNVNEEILDPKGDIEQTNLDIVKVSTILENNDLNVYIYLESLSNASNLEVYIDLDGNPETGAISSTYKKGAEYIVRIEFPISTQTYEIQKYNSSAYYMKTLQFDQNQNYIQIVLDDIHVTEKSLISVVSMNQENDYLVCE